MNLTLDLFQDYQSASNNLLIQNDKADFSGLQITGNINEVANTTRQPIQAGNNQLIAFTNKS